MRKPILIGALAGFLLTFPLRLGLGFGNPETRVSLVDLSLGTLLGAIVGFGLARTNYSLLKSADPQRQIQLAWRVFQLFCVCLYLPLVWAGVSSARLGLSQMSAEAALQGWPSTNGVITESRIRATSITREYENYDRSSPDRRYQRTIDVYEPIVSYSYRVDGSPRVGNRISLAMTQTEQRQTIENLLAPYKVGSEVPVFYNPQDSSQSVLQKHSGFSLWAPLLLGVIVLVLSTCVLCFFCLTAFSRNAFERIIASGSTAS